VIALVFDGEEYLFEGVSEGQIAKIKTGSKGFGYDPIFIPEGFDRSFAEMTMKEKSKISHRGRAVDKLIAFLSTSE
jgi:XTP/dITP diphosphohydrolase